MPKLGYYVLGDYNSQCDECGRGFKFSQLSLRWDGAWVDRDCWEIRQPQDFVKGIKDVQGVPIARPRVLPLNSITTLAAPVIPTDLSLTVATGTGANFPTLSGNTMFISIQSLATPSIYEFIQVGGHAAGSDSFTALTRARLGSVAQSFAIGDTLNFIVTK